MGWIADVVTRTTIRSVWGNQIRDRTVQAFANAGERDAHATVPDGALNVPLDSGIVERKWQGVWRQVAPLAFRATGLAVVVQPGQTQRSFGTLAGPGYRSALFAYYARIGLVSPPSAGVLPILTVNVYVGGSLWFQTNAAISPTGNDDIAYTWLVDLDPTIQQPIVVDLVNTNGVSVIFQTFNSQAAHSGAVVLYP